MNEEVKNLLKKTVGSENFLSEKEDLICYSYDGTPFHRIKPDLVLLPGSEEEIAEIINIANRHKIPVIPRGSGTGLSGGSIALSGGIVLKTNRLNRILEIDQANMTALVEPGVITAEFHKEVEKLGLFYPPDPASMNISTLGGNAAENAGGLRGLKYGVTEDYILGLKGVFADGTRFNLGGKNVKDVSGYNLTKLLVGSEGTLGIFTQILLKLIPKPEFKKTILIQFKKMDNASDTVSEVIASKILPCTFEFLDNLTIKCVEEYAKIGLPTDIDALLLAELDGDEAVVNKESEILFNIAEKHGAISIDIAKTEEEALKLTEARRSALSALARQKPTTVLEDLTVPRNKLTEILLKIREVADKYGLTIGIFGHIGDGNIHPTCLTDERNKSEIEKVEKAFDEIYKKTMELGGTITGEHGVGISKKKYFKKFSDPGIYEIMKGIKKVIDPNNILNPGKIFDIQ